MPAYLREFARCVCGKPIAVEVFNALNSSQGRWCKTCGQQLVKELNARADAEKKKSK